MRFTALQSTGMRTAIPLSGASAADTGHAVRPASPCYRGRHDLPDAPLRRVAVHLSYQSLPESYTNKSLKRQARRNHVNC